MKDKPTNGYIVGRGFEWPDYWLYSMDDNVTTTETQDPFESWVEDDMRPKTDSKVGEEDYVFKVGDKVVSENPKIICTCYAGVVGEVVEIAIGSGVDQVMEINYPDGVYQTGYSCMDSIKLAEEPTSDSVKHPNHYNQDGQIECIDAIKAALGLEGFAAYCRGNTIKYLWRYKRKGGVEDLKKSQQYLTWLIETEEEISKCSSQ